MISQLWGTATKNNQKPVVIFGVAIHCQLTESLSIQSSHERALWGATSMIFLLWWQEQYHWTQDWTSWIECSTIKSLLAKHDEQASNLFIHQWQAVVSVSSKCLSTSLPAKATSRFNMESKRSPTRTAWKVHSAKRARHENKLCPHDSPCHQ